MSADLQDRLARYGTVLDRAQPGSDNVVALPEVGGPRGRRPAPRLVAAAAAASVFVAAAIGFAGWGGPNVQQVEVGPAAGDGSAPVLPAADPGAFPLLVIEGWQVERADQTSGQVSGEPFDPGAFAQVYRDPARGFDGPQLMVRTSSSAGFGELPGGAQPVDVATGEAWLLGSDPFFAAMMWSPGDGRTVLMGGTRIGVDELVEVVRGLRPRPDGQGWELTALPSGLQPVLSTSPARPERFHTAEVHFTRDGAGLELRMEAGDELAFEYRVDDRVAEAVDLRPVTVLGLTGALTRYEGGQRYSAMWFDNGVVYELTGDVGGADAFLAALDGLRPVDRATWEEALPERAVTAAERDLEVNLMLNGVYLPPGFDRPSLSEVETTDRYQLGARVAGAVACRWIDEWARARAAGDDAAVAEAVAAMQTSRNWPVLVEMDAEGDYPEVVWELAAAMAGDGTVLGGREMSVGEAAPAALGCQ